MFAGLVFIIILFYTSSDMRPIFGEWELEKNDILTSVTFPVSEELREDDFIILRKTFEMTPLYDRLTFTIYPTIRNADVYINGEYAFKMDSLEKMNENPPPYIFLTYQLPERFRDQTITLEIRAYGPQTIYFGYYPMLANPQILKTVYIRSKILESDVYIFAMGMQGILSFLMISIALSARQEHRAYFRIGLGILIQIFYLLNSVIAFNLNYSLSSGMFSFVLPMVLITSFTFIYQGLEVFMTQTLKYTRHLVRIIPLLGLLYALIPLSESLKAHLIAIYFIAITCLMIFIAVRKGRNSLLTHSLYLMLFTTIYDFYIRESISIFPMPALQTYAIIVLNFIFGSFFAYTFIAAYKRERDLRMDLAESYEEIHTSNEELEDSYQEIEGLNNSLEQKVKERTEALDLTIKDLKMILDNTDEGFLTLDKLQRAEDTYSSECERIFGCPPVGIKFSKLLYPEAAEGEQAAFIDEIITAIQGEPGDLRRDAYLSLLPEEKTINGLYVELEYKWIDDAIPGEKQLMIMLRDMTSKHELENRIELERNNLSKIVKIMLNLEEFMRIDTDYRQFMEVEVFNVIDESATFLRTITFIKRRVHTFKGNLASFGLSSIAAKLHLLEDDLSALMQEKELSESEQTERIRRLFRERNTVEWLSEEEELIKEDISTDIFREERFYRVYPEQLDTLKKRLNEILPKELIEPVREEVMKIEYRSLKELFNYYRFVVENLCEKLGKTVNPLRIQGNNYYVDTDRFDKWIGSLIHIFRNCIDHGIENADERILAGKSEYGQIIVDIRKRNTELIIEISDDGRGIDTERVGKEAVRRELLTETERQAMTQEQLLNIVFLDGFSTKEEATLISGRGVGLSSVREEWEELGGTLHLISEKGKGTTFIFTLKLPN